MSSLKNAHPTDASVGWANAYGVVRVGGSTTDRQTYLVVRGTLLGLTIWLRWSVGWCRNLSFGFLFESRTNPVFDPSNQVSSGPSSTCEGGIPSEPSFMGGIPSASSTMSRPFTTKRLLGNMRNSPLILHSPATLQSVHNLYLVR